MVRRILNIVRKHFGGSLSSDAVMESVPKGSLVAHTNAFQMGGAKKPTQSGKSTKSTTSTKSTKPAKPAKRMYRQCGGSVASDAVQALVPESAMHLQTNLFCPPENPQVGAGWKNHKKTMKPKAKAHVKAKKEKKQGGGGEMSMPFGMSLPAPATGDMAHSLAVPANGFMDISSSVLSKLAAYPDCLSQSKFIFGGVQDGAGKKRQRPSSSKSRSRSARSSDSDCQCGGAAKKSSKSSKRPLPKIKSSRKRT